MNIFETVRDIIADQLDVEKDAITPETSFEEDLEADSYFELAKIKLMKGEKNTAIKYANIAIDLESKRISEACAMHSTVYTPGKTGGPVPPRQAPVARRYCR